MLYSKNTTGCEQCPLILDCSEISPINETDPLATAINLSTRNKSTNFHAETEIAKTLTRYRSIVKDSYNELESIDPEIFLCNSLQAIFERHLVPTKTKQFDVKNIEELEAKLLMLSLSCQYICSDVSIYNAPVDLSWFEDNIIDAAESESIDIKYATDSSALIAELLGSKILLEVDGKYIVKPEYRSLLKNKLSQFDT